MTTSVLAMFPLGSVLLPGMGLPLRVFEPRYQVMMAEVLASDRPRFGVVLIERGSEVGGGDVRTDVGCLAAVHSAHDAPDGSLEVMAVGTDRVRVLGWLPEDPFPVARVELWPDEDDGGDGIDASALRRLTTEVDELVRLVSAFVGTERPSPELSDDPGMRTFQLATLAPLGPLDRQRVLCAAGAASRAELLRELVDEQRILLEARRRFSDP